jgi:hypothetical protein
MMSYENDSQSSFLADNFSVDVSQQMWEVLGSQGQRILNQLTGALHLPQLCWFVVIDERGRFDKLTKAGGGH